MVARTGLAWRLLQITALALPALAILLQALTQMTSDETSDIVHHYMIATFTLVLVVPLALTGTITIVVIMESYQITWLNWAAGLMAISFLFLPIFLALMWRGNRRLFVSTFLEREKEAVQKLAEQDEIPEDEEDRIKEEIEAHQSGFLKLLQLRSKRIDQFFQRHPLLSIGKNIALFALGVSVLTQDSVLWMKFIAGWLILYSSVGILRKFIHVPTDISE